MEEIYKPDTEKVEIYNSESNEILGDMPGWLIHTGSHIVYGLIILLIVGATWFQYPDTVEKNIRIDDTGSVEWITANHSGIIDQFFVEDQAQVKCNDTLAILKNTALLEDVKRFGRMLDNIQYYNQTKDIHYLQNYPHNLIMGDMTSAYEQITQAVHTCLTYQEFNLYPQKKKYLDEELKILSKNGKADELTLLKIKREMFNLEINHKIERSKNNRTLETAYETMVNNIRIWDAKYLIKCQNSGTFIRGKSWSISKKINEGDTLCTVIFQTIGKPAGHIRLSENEVSDIDSGDNVNIELSKYPAHSYGKLSGKVSSISFVPYNKSYAVEVEFPDGLVTTSGEKIEYTIGMSGHAEIITSSKTILNRILSPFTRLIKE